MTHPSRVLLDSVSDIKKYYSDNQKPIIFVSPTNFNVMGIHRWVDQWLNITLLDCFDGRHPNILNIKNDSLIAFTSTQDINKYLLTHEKTQKIMSSSADGPKPAFVFLFFDDVLEQICASMGSEVLLPPNKLVREIDSKIMTTELGNAVGVRSVPNVLTKINSFDALKTIAREAGLGDRWVIQAAYGDSGKTTFFIQSETDYSKVSALIEKEDQVKVMRWIRCTESAIEACATRWGTFVGPLMTELIGLEELTPYKGGWCGNELYPDVFSTEVRAQVRQKSQAIGDALYEKGYRGYFELDYLIDLDSGEVFLGEINARITGISAMTNLSDFSDRQIPLFLFHLLEFDPNVDLTLKVGDFNDAVLACGAEGIAAQVILKYAEDPLTIVTNAPVSGVYTLDGDRKLTLMFASHERRDALGPNEIFIMRITSKGDHAYKGCDLAIMFLNTVICEKKGHLNLFGKEMVNALKSLFEFRALNSEERSQVELCNSPGSVKSMEAL